MCEVKSTGRECVIIYWQGAANVDFGSQYQDQRSSPSFKFLAKIFKPKLMFMCGD